MEADASPRARPGPGLSALSSSTGDDKVGPMPGNEASHPLVTVVIRTHNRPTFLEAALRDVAGQDFSDLEVIVVNDGDDVEPVEEAVARVDTIRERVRVLDRTQEEHGRARAANAGLRAARGDLLVLHDDDDTWDPAFLAKTVGYLHEHPSCVAVSAHTEVVRHLPRPVGEPEIIERLPLNPDLSSITIPDMLRENRVTTHSLLYRATVHDEIGYLDESLPAHEDWEFYLRLIARHPIELLPLPPLAFWHHRPDSTGDDRNSVYALSDEHEAAKARVQDDLMREAFARHGLGAFVHLSAEMNRQDRARADEQRLLVEMGERLDDTLRQIADLRRITEQSRSRLSALLIERTSFGGWMRRVKRVFRP
ncbi:glycosyltransferase [Microbacterium sp. X-17]|uniref:glycosyltransferase family 2 protein n=1 Tax=Microbacterium sp. X-17 TaxID=3144404 RepID=UPI0031F4AAD7